MHSPAANQPNDPNRQLPPGRIAVYYLGMILSIVGLLLFLSTFVTFFSNFGNFNNIDDLARSFVARAFGGIMLLGVGGALRSIGVKGWAGAGVVLDPQQARKDIEPWSRMGGGMVQDALSEVDVVNRLGEHLAPPEPQVKIRCPACKSLNDETAKFCSQCGSAI
jgi:hypothetical protein